MRCVFCTVLGCFGVRHAKELGDRVGVTEEAVVPDHTREHRTQRQNTQRGQHDHRAFMRVFMRVLVAACFAEERQEDKAPAVERCEQSGHNQHPEGIATCGACIGAFDHGIFGQEARKTDVCQRNTDTGDRQCTDHHRPECVGQLFTQTAVVPHVLFVVHPVDHGTRAKEQHRFEERVCEQVEHRDRINTDTGSNEHVTQLGTCRIGDDAFDVVLDQTNSRREEGCCCAKECHEGHRLGGEFHQGRHTANKEDTRCNHGRRVDQGRHRCRAFHRVRQPCVQDQLSRFTHRADEQQEGQQVCCVPFGPQEGQVGFCQCGGRSENVVKADRVHQEEQAEDTQRKAEVTDTVDDKGLDRSRVCGRLFVVETDQQVGCDAHAFPAEEHLNKVVRCNQHKHGEGKEGQVRKEARLIVFTFFEVVVMGHVAHRIQVHQGRDRGDHDQHDRSQTVQTDRPVGGQCAAFNPAQDLDVFGRAVKGQEDNPRQDSRKEQKAGGDPLRNGFAGKLPAKPRNERAHQWGK